MACQQCNQGEAVQGLLCAACIESNQQRQKARLHAAKTQLNPPVEVHHSGDVRNFFHGEYSLFVLVFLLSIPIFIGVFCWGPDR